MGKNAQHLNTTDKANSVSVFILFWMMIVVPLYVENRYFNILQAKGHAFTVGGVLGIILIITQLISGKSETLNPVKYPIDLGVLMLSSTSIISCVLCGNFKASLFGNQGWCVGGLAFFLAAILYLYLSRSFQFRHNYWLPVVGVNAFIFTVTILHSMGIDAFGLHTNMQPKQYYLYVSTIGNINMLVGYLCLIMPLLVCFFIESKTRESRVIYLIILTLGELNMILSASDGLYLGIGVCAFFAIPYLFHSKESTIKTALLLLIYGLSLMLVALCPCFAGKRVKITGISAVFLKPPVFISIVLIAAAGVIMLSMISEDRFKRISGRMIILFESILGAVSVVFIVRTIQTFDASWGTHRGGIWTWLIGVYWNLDFTQKFFGVGPELLGPYLEGLQWGANERVLSAHSEPLQILMTTGIAGLISWVTIWFGLIKRFFKRRLWKSSAMPYFLSLMAYLGQCLVNTPMATNFGILVVVISLFVYNSDIGLKYIK